jgi:hypothetical protein
MGIVSRAASLGGWIGQARLGGTWRCEDAVDELEPEIGSIDHFDEDAHLGDFITPVEEAPAAYRRTFMQEMFAGLGPRVRRTRARIR